MDNLLIALFGVAIGTYYADSIRKEVPILDPNKSNEKGEG